jgi:hypothetical protein
MKMSSIFLLVVTFCFLRMFIGLNARWFVSLILMAALPSYAYTPSGKLTCPNDHVEVVRVPFFDQLAKKNDAFFIDILSLALEKTQNCVGDFRVVHFLHKYSSKRFRAELFKRNGVIDIYWSMNSPQIQKDLLPIKIPLLRGMNGYRVLVIRREDESKFKNIRTLGDLSDFSAGQGVDWPDVDILRDNGLKVVTSNQSDLLYKMLAGKRFDYFPRGVHEAWSELELNGDDSLMVSNDIVLFYPAPVFFIVNKNNRRLADRIYRGLELAKADGSFQRLFDSFPNFVFGINEMKNSKRYRLHLQAPFAGEYN